ncbi:Metalloenzyme, LuxS/M16 peptidase-like protein [Epithele typhae]|uniref:Metalloenzyme, LuxS/M16 peptidase-like protein n=1 Tax=Epithele typhae TaxID=378194 RepID=UPI0020078AE8|nr:Metalloenzyme, LuxS/M16 peptidase-like protein [Epithele typhae]KAH9945848.1 Metalloenzyme, LuxS/M16 peptidase-like protein [Epithele typhae]
MAASVPVAWTRVTAGQTSFSVFPKPIQKSPQDDREYRIIKLDNGLQAMLIHDAKADKAAASLDVAVGHLYDPDDMPGLAHFCEHLLFMYLSKNNGSSNAFTGTSNTNYYFNVSTTALYGALSRFSGFFHSPLFAPSCTARELNAVDSEHKRNHQSDMWRIFQTNKHLSKDGHPWRKFGTGHKESLSKVGRELKAKGTLNSNLVMKSADGSLAPTPNDSRAPSPSPSVNSTSSEMDGDGGVVGRETRRRLVEWWSNEYCAGRMRLCVVGNESLDELAAMVAKLFSPIPNRGREPLHMIPDHPFGPNEMGTLVSVHTIMAFHALEISFPIPYLPPYWRHKPASFLAHFIGHEGPGSLHSYLKGKGWITDLSSGPQNLARGFAMFKVTLRMTPQGFENYETIMEHVFNYISLLRSSKFPAWYQRERSQISATRFRFAEKRRPDDYAVWVTEHMTWPVPPDLVISAPQLVEEWDENDAEHGGEKEMRAFLDLLSIERSRAVLMAKAEEHERVRGKDVVWEKEPWYGTPYRVERLSVEIVQKARGPNNLSELFLPGPNEFIPTNLEVEKRDVETPAKRPQLVRQTPLSSLWHKKDDQFWVPRARVVIDIRSPLANSSARSIVMTRLFADLVTDSLTEFSYDADLAGLAYTFSPQSLGLYVMLHGYNDKLHVLTKDILTRARRLEIKPERLEVMKDQAKREWENHLLGAPYRLSNYYYRFLLAARDWSVEELIAEVASITPEELRKYITTLLSKVHMNMLVIGNMYKDEACGLAKMAEDIIQASPIPADEVQELSLVLPPGSNHTWATVVPNKNEANSSLTKRRVTASLLAHILSEPAFNVLRTREQLGYIVSAGHWQVNGGGQSGIGFVIQSERTQELFEHKTSLQKQWREAPKNLNEEMNRYWNHIEYGFLDFHRRFIEADLIEGVTKEEVLELFSSHVDPSSKERSKLSIHLKSQKPRPPKISIAAMEAFAQKVAEKGYTVEEQAWRDALVGDGETALDKFGQYWRDTLLAQAATVPPEVAQGLTAEVPVLMKQCPAVDDGADEATLGKDVIFIQEPNAFRASLAVNERPQPMVEWGDLPTSKY